MGSWLGTQKFVLNFSCFTLLYMFLPIINRRCCIIIIHPTGNGFIEGTELDGFLREFVASANPTEVNSEVSESTLKNYMNTHANKPAAAGKQLENIRQLDQPKTRLTCAPEKLSMLILYLLKRAGHFLFSHNFQFSNSLQLSLCTTSKSFGCCEIVHEEIGLHFSVDSKSKLNGMIFFHFSSVEFHSLWSDWFIYF